MNRDQKAWREEGYSTRLSHKNYDLTVKELDEILFEEYHVPVHLAAIAFNVFNAGLDYGIAAGRRIALKEKA